MRTLSLVLAAVMILAMLPATSLAADVVASGDCGYPVSGDTPSSDAQWTLYSDGLLSITATEGDAAGASMYNYGSASDCPWADGQNSVNVQTVEIGSGIADIGQYAFSGLANLTSVSIPASVTSIGDYAFNGSQQLSSVTFASGSTLTSIGQHAFFNCKALTDMTIPAGVSTIGQNAFAGCTNLAHVSLPSGLTAVADHTFEGCSKLIDITIPANVTSIGTSAFSTCTALTEVTIPASVNSIGTSAFNSCTNLKTVKFEGNKPTTLDTTSFRALTNAIFYYPLANSASWAPAPEVGATNPKWRAYTTETNTITVSAPNTVSSTNAYITLTSSPVNFAADRAVSHFSVDAGEDNPGYSVTGMNSSGASGTESNSVTLTIAKPAGKPWVERLSIIVSPNALAADVLSEDSGVVSTSLTADITHTHTAGSDGYCVADDGHCMHTKGADGFCTTDGCEHLSTCTCGGVYDIGDAPIDSPPPSANPPVYYPTNPEPTPTPEPVLPNGGEIGVPNAADEVVSIVQDIVKEKTAVDEYVDWIDRIEPPEYASNFYEVLSDGTESGEEFSACLVEDDYFTVDPRTEQSGTVDYDVDAVEEFAFSLTDIYGNDTPVLDSTSFSDESFYTVGVSYGDTKVDYASLKTGDVVRTPNFNGVFVVSKATGDDFDAVKKETVAYIGTVYQAFDRDHPEVFWLSGKCKIRITTAKSADGVKNAYFFLSLADKDGFTMRSPDWTASGAVAAGIARRDAAIDKILKAVTGDTAEEKMRSINRILTEQNEYNTTPDLTTIGNEPHECLSALEGRVGRSGPVCEGYARAFKILCDKLGILCVLEDGYAKPTADSTGTFHMWNAVKLGDQWFGTDVTWNDPVVAGISGAKSGYENEQFLLVGATTEIMGQTFAVSHPAINRATQGGVSFNNGPALSAFAFAFDPAILSLPFADIRANDWFAPAVAYVYKQGLMVGTDEKSFSPNESVTRGQLWMVLARLAGEQPESMDVALEWTVENGITDGTAPADNLSRQQLVTALYRYCELKKYDTADSAELTGFPDGDSVAEYAVGAMKWAIDAEIIRGSDGEIKPNDTATRAEFAAVMQRFCAKIGA